jgi:hypothetical protein
MVRGTPLLSGLVRGKQRVGELRAGIASPNEREQDGSNSEKASHCEQVSKFAHSRWRERECLKALWLTEQITHLTRYTTGETNYATVGANATSLSAYSNDSAAKIKVSESRRRREQDASEILGRNGNPFVDISRERVALPRRRRDLELYRGSPQP